MIRQMLVAALAMCLVSCATAGATGPDLDVVRAAAMDRLDAVGFDDFDEETPAALPEKGGEQSEKPAAIPVCACGVTLGQDGVKLTFAKGCTPEGRLRGLAVLYESLGGMVFCRGVDAMGVDGIMGLLREAEGVARVGVNKAAASEGKE